MTDVRRRVYGVTAAGCALLALALASALVLAQRAAAADPSAMMARARCDERCGRALGRIISYVFRFLVQHFGWGWGLTGLLALVAAVVGVQLWFGDDNR